jgi:hypothetical protein
MAVVKGLAIEKTAGRGSIRDLDVARLRRALNENGPLDRAEAEGLLDLDRACPVQDPAWSGLLVEAIAHFIVDVESPEGYLTRDNADWLLHNIAPAGRVGGKTGIDLVFRVLETARWVPLSLSVAALKEVARAVIDGEGPLRAGRNDAPGQISAGEVALLQRALVAYARSTPVAITPCEAEVLFAIEAALAAEGGDLAWMDLYVKALTNLAMAAGGHAVPTRAQALKADRWTGQGGGSAGGAMLTTRVEAMIDAALDLYPEQTREERAISQLERRRIEIITAEDIDRAEAGWLWAHLERGGSAIERAFAAHLARVTAVVPGAAARAGAA